MEEFNMEEFKIIFTFVVLWGFSVYLINKGIEGVQRIIKRRKRKKVIYEMVHQMIELRIKKLEIDTKRIEEQLNRIEKL